MRLRMTCLSAFLGRILIAMHFKKIEVNGERGAPFNGRPDCPVRFVKENE